MSRKKRWIHGMTRPGLAGVRWKGSSEAGQAGRRRRQDVYQGRCCVGGVYWRASQWWSLSSGVGDWEEAEDTGEAKGQETLREKFWSLSHPSWGEGSGMYPGGTLTCLQVKVQSGIFTPEWREWNYESKWDFCWQKSREKGQAFFFRLFWRAYFCYLYGLGQMSFFIHKEKVDVMNCFTEYLNGKFK